MPSLTTSAERPRTPQPKDVSSFGKPDSCAFPEEKTMADLLNLKFFPPLKRFKIMEKARRAEHERLIQLQQNVVESRSKAPDDRVGLDYVLKADPKDRFQSLLKGIRREVSQHDVAPELVFFRMLQKEGLNTEDIDAARDWSCTKGSTKQEERSPLNKRSPIEEYLDTVFRIAPSKRGGITSRIHAPRMREGQCSKEAASEASDSEDDGIICDVCRSSDGEPADPIVFCDGCDLTVHASCYGNPLCKKVPEGDWFCKMCQRKDLATQTCCLCLSSKGAMKPTTDNKWAHISCALFVPEVFFRSAEEREPIDCSQIPERRWQMSCSICKRSGGACVECTETACVRTFHVTCGLKRDLALEFREGKTGSVVLAFCENHTSRWEKQQKSKERGRYKIVPRQPVAVKKKTTTKFLTRSKRDN